MSTSPDQPRGTSGFTAEEIVGWNVEGNLSLMADRLEKAHIEPLVAFGPDADPLIGCLRTPDVAGLFPKYDAFDRRAGKAQNAYRGVSPWIPLPTALALTLCLLLLMVPLTPACAWLAKQLGWGREGAMLLESLVRQGVPWLVLGLLFLTPILRWWYDPDRLYREWHEQRGSAETLRRQIFTRLMQAAPDGLPRGDPWLLQLKLEYFRRWQVEVQQAYFERRPRQLRSLEARSAIAGRAYVVGLIALGLVLAASAFAAGDEQGVGLLHDWSHGPRSWTTFVESRYVDSWSLLAVALTLVAGVFFFIQSRLGSPLRDAARYKTMQDNFNAVILPRPQVPEYLAEARSAAARGDEAGVLKYVDRVHAMMSVEASDWIRLRDLDVGVDRSGQLERTPAPALTP